ncbi:phosphoserine phosphatase SerB [Leeia sp.]|uniref:phosphoserine phosphatase SerB n=1 Tax=Leeia sp. TaxID=2884678 RepID=UPI0035B456AB
MPLIVHALRDIDPAHLALLAQLSHSAAPVLRHPQCGLLDEAQPAERARIASLCAQWQYDHAWVDARPLSSFGLVAMDMDSTLITIECVDEIADLQGLKAEVAAITERSMAGELDFASSLRERVALLAGLPEAALDTVYQQRLALQPGAERMLKQVHAAGLQTLLISGGFTFFTERLQQRLGLTHAIANRLEVHNGHLTGRVEGELIDAAAKARHLQRLRDAAGLQPDQTIAFGDGANDIPMFQAAAVSIAFRGKPALKHVATACFDHVGLDGLLNLFPN